MCAEIWDKAIRFNDEYVDDWRNTNPLAILDLIDGKSKSLREMLLKVARGEKVPRNDFLLDVAIIQTYLVSLLGTGGVTYGEFKNAYETMMFNWAGQVERKKRRQVDSSFNPLEYYNMRFSLGYVGDHPDHMFNAKWIAERFNPESLLDVGCGKGFTIRNLLLLKPETFCVGLDVSDVAIGQKVFENGVVGCGWKLPFKDKSFELVYSGGTLEHFPMEYIDETVREFSRVGVKNVHYLALNSGDEPVRSENREHTTIAKRSWWIDKIGSNENWLIGGYEDADDLDLGFEDEVGKEKRRTWTRVNWESEELDKYFKK